jgi:hypothetical protein
MTTRRITVSVICNLATAYVICKERLWANSSERTAVVLSCAALWDVEEQDQMRHLEMWKSRINCGTERCKKARSDAGLRDVEEQDQMRDWEM